MGEGESSLCGFSCSLDSDQKDQLIEVIEKLLADKTTVRMQLGKGDGAHQPRGALPSLPCSPAWVLSSPSWWQAVW